jgi:hypothetical protein
MNERIEAYLKQHYCRDYFNSYGETVEDDYYFMYREEVEGLIELIVREMCQVINADCELQYSEGITTNLGGLNQARELIKKHFGVE